MRNDMRQALIGAVSRDLENQMVVGNSGLDCSCLNHSCDICEPTGKTARQVIEDYEDANELIGESLARIAIDDPEQRLNVQIVTCILNGDDTEAGRILREIVFAQAQEWAAGDY